MQRAKAADFQRLKGMNPPKASGERRVVELNARGGSAVYRPAHFRPSPDLGGSRKVGSDLERQAEADAGFHYRRLNPHWLGGDAGDDRHPPAQAELASAVSIVNRRERLEGEVGEDVGDEEVEPADEREVGQVAERRQVEGDV